jgi:uncharacterized protein
MIRGVRPATNPPEDHPAPAAPARGPSGERDADRLSAAILDTQVALDWLLFDDPAVSPLAGAIQDGRLRWLLTPAMRAEFADVIARPALARWQPDPPRLLARMDALAQMLEAPAAIAPPRPRCRDPDDQVFVDAALACGAGWLFSRDKALLELAAPLRLRGVQVQRPGDWRGLDAAPPDGRPGRP